ncbi:MAG: HAMP domain-containing sensor histidine kinase [Myxococcota bacterium]|nr:HAMP domain-containing sensor histidine kinase [Myxococcota bacterium]
MSEAADWGVETKSTEESLKQLAEAMPEGVLLLRDGQIVWASRRLVEMAGWGSAEALVDAELSQILVDTGQGLPDERLRPAECGMQRANGQELTVVCRPAWPAIEPGTDAWVVEDASRVRELEAELLRMSRDLHRANRDVAGLREEVRRASADRQELLGVLAHELRTPLTVIGGYARLLLEEEEEVGPLRERQRRFLHETQRSCQKLDVFVERLLEGARRPETGEVLEVATGSLVPVIDEVAGALVPLLEKSDVTLSVELDPEHSAARFDLARVEQILTNLLGNAIRYAGEGGRVEVSARPVQADGRDLLEVSVADTGPGVPAEDRGRIFEPYVQSGGSGSGGLGLGLAICRRLVEAHGGTLAVGDRPGGGARFFFTLPAAGS